MKQQVAGDSGWIVGGKEGPRNHLTAIELTTGDIVEIDLGIRGALEIAAYLADG